MDETIASRIEALKNMPLLDLQKTFQELCKTQEMPCDNKMYLIKRIAYKLQEDKHGGLSNTAKAKVNELTAKYDPINNKALRPQIISAGKGIGSMPFSRDKRLPIPGTIITKKYKDQTIQVKVLEKGFEYLNTYYKTLSAVAQEITGAHWNGFNFFNL
ncbi:MAG: DUF2924 domain-containing protein [Candidatus Omnitrophica bacterium]|nr:DUF2924 domain-containing protein [Candidatus Omnitrophota bacterium]